jgi:hypothetical protein
MNLRELERRCEAAELESRRRGVRPATFVVPCMVPTRGRTVTIAPGLRGDVEAAGDGDEFPTLVVLACRDVRAFLRKAAAVGRAGLELQPEPTE